MRKKLFQLIAMFCIEMLVFLPMSFTAALTITTGQNPIKDVNSTSATIEWLTDVDATSSVHYGKTDQLGLDETDSAMDTYHSVSLQNLQANTRYFFQLMSVSGLGDVVFEDNNGDFYTFTTRVQAEITPPVITNISIVSKTATTTAIRWETDESSNSKIYFAEAGEPLADMREAGSFVKTHVLTIPSEDDVQYEYIVSSCDVDGNCANSTKQAFTGGIDITAPVIGFDIPSWSTESRISISGDIEPYSEIEVLLEGQPARYIAAEYTASGFVTISNFVLPASENNITIIATDQAGNRAVRDYRVSIDQSPPTLNVTGLPNVTDAGSATVTVGLTEPSTVIFESGVIDTVAPGRVTGLAVDSSVPTLLKLSWDASTESDLDEYGIYRKPTDDALAPWKMIAVASQNSFQDAKIMAGGQYSYRVSAVDKKCNEGELSEVADGVASLAAPKLMPEPPEVNFTCQQRIDSVFKDGGTFTHQITFEEGANTVRIRAIDRAGHIAVYTKNVLYDLEAPVIEITNLGALTPTYIPTVTITGQVSEEAGIAIYINDKAEYSGQTDPGGAFSVTLDLKRETVAVDATGTGISGSVGTGGSWTNQVKIIATDYVGRVSAPVEEDIIYTMCGYGSWFRTDVGGHPASAYGTGGLTPSMLNPRAVLDGTEIIAFPMNFSYTGGYSATISNIIIKKDFVAEEDKEEYDIDWVSEPSVMCTPDKTICYVQMTVDAPDPTPDGENWTLYQKEENISQNNVENCLTSGASIGCVRVPILLEIQFQEQRPQVGPPLPGQFPGQSNLGNLVQKQCWEIEIAIDSRVPPDVIPESLLERIIEIFDTVINISTALLEPINTVKEVLFIGCTAMWIAQFATTISTNTACKKIEPSKSAIDALGTVTALTKEIAGGHFNPNIAKIGKCKVEYVTPEGKSPDITAAAGKSLANCLMCENALKNKEKVEYAMKQLCDRIFCPSAPTFQKYVKDMSKKKLKKVTGHTTQTEYFVGSDCSCSIGDSSFLNTCDEVPENEKGKVKVPFDVVKNQYVKYKDYKEWGGKENPCVELHPAGSGCCSTEYMRQWGSACGFGAEAGFHELEKSLCLAAQSENKPSEVVTSKGTVTCNKNLANAAGGMCDPAGRTVVDPIPILKNIKKNYLKEGPPVTRFTPTVSPDEIGLHACVFPPVEGGEITKHEVKLCYATTKGVVANNTDLSANRGFIPMQKQFGFFVIKGGDVTSSFDVDEETTEKQIKGKKAAFQGKVQGYVAGTYTEKDSNEKYDQIKDSIGDPKQEYIVNPTSGVGISFICICLTAMTAYLNLIIRVSTALRNCFNTILVTGDGSGGVCQAVVSTYVCDLLYELIKCASKKYGSSPGKRKEAGDSFGDFFGTLTKSGSDVSDSVSGRYGASATWKAMFVEKKLMHAVCLWIFTGTWDIDFETLFEGEEISPPIASIGMLYPCKRRFKSFNPITTPSGLTNWEYEFGAAIIPGAALTYDLKLICSQGYTCDASDGFTNGECDCKNGKRELTVRTGSLALADMLDERIFFPVQGSGQTSVRYDKAVLKWSWTDSNGEAKSDEKECDVEGVGADTPLFCNFDLGHLVFRCSMGFETEHWARLNSVTPSYSSGQTYFRMGDPLQFYLDIEQGIPSNPTCTSQNCEHTRYLRGAIYNNHGGVVWQSDPTTGAGTKRLNTGGQSVFTFPDPTSFVTVPVLKVADFSTTGGGAVTAFPCLGPNGVAPAGVTLPPNGCKDDQGTRGCPAVCENKHYVTIAGTPTGTAETTVVLAMDGSQYKVYRSNPLLPKANAPANPSFSNNFFKNTHTQLVVQPGVWGNQPSAALNNIGNTGISLNIFKQSKYVEIAINIIPTVQAGGSGAQAQCQQMATFNDAQSKKWRAEFKIHRAKQDGASWTISDTVEATKSVEFVAVCSEDPQAGGAAATNKIRVEKGRNPGECLPDTYYDQRLYITYLKEDNTWERTCFYVVPEDEAPTEGEEYRKLFIVISEGCDASGACTSAIIGNFDKLSTDPSDIDMPSYSYTSNNWANYDTYIDSGLALCNVMDQRTITHDDFTKLKACAMNPQSCTNLPMVIDVGDVVNPQLVHCTTAQFPNPVGYYD